MRISWTIKYFFVTSIAILASPTTPSKNAKRIHQSSIRRARVDLPTSPHLDSLHSFIFHLLPLPSSPSSHFDLLSQCLQTLPLRRLYRLCPWTPMMMIRLRRWNSIASAATRASIASNRARPLHCYSRISYDTVQKSETYPSIINPARARRSPNFSAS